ncbi:MAG TPA: phosphoribosylformylglycinamidine cyclo-ligase, partial [Alphaproteobacteria bacterium]|nr:phosphoribosylformylglycinamidine cyclo-ligase [Alphaproteobacteria bacterium]
LSYEQAGVNIAEGNEFVKDIGQIIKRSWRTGVMNDLGGFAGFFDLKACGFKDPILLSATDGVGTKIELARSTNIYGGLGMDLVAMCVNDLIVHGGQPLFFLDYLASGKLDRHNHLAIVESMV